MSLCCSVGSAAERILLLGDSLSAAYGIPQERSWPALLEKHLQQQAVPSELINASISGETTAGGLRRLPALLQDHQPTWVWIELGANDGLRGLPLDQMRSNLRAMIDSATQASARVLLFEMRLPTNYGPRYTQAFSAVYSQLAAQTPATVLPFFLAPIAADMDYFLDDGIHPNEAAQPILLDQILEGWPGAETALGSAPG